MFFCFVLLLFFFPSALSNGNPEYLYIQHMNLSLKNIFFGNEINVIIVLYSPGNVLFQMTVAGFLMEEPDVYFSKGVHINLTFDYLLMLWLSMWIFKLILFGSPSTVRYKRPDAMQISIIQLLICSVTFNPSTLLRLCRVSLLFSSSAETASASFRQLLPLEFYARTKIHATSLEVGANAAETKIEDLHDPLNRRLRFPLGPFWL